jgi:hypothetical protein
MKENLFKKNEKNVLKVYFTPLDKKITVKDVNHTFVSEYFFGEPDLARFVYFLFTVGGSEETFAGFGGCTMFSVESRSTQSGSSWQSMSVFNG